MRTVVMTGATAGLGAVAARHITRSPHTRLVAGSRGNPVDGAEVLFERDEEGSYRALVPPSDNLENVPRNAGKPPDSGLLQAIAEAIERILA